MKLLSAIIVYISKITKIIKVSQSSEFLADLLS